MPKINRQLSAYLRAGSGKQPVNQANGRSTYYASMWFRSVNEARFAVLFDRLGIPWQYESYHFRIGERWTYTPDFVIDFLSLPEGVDEIIPDRLWPNINYEAPSPSYEQSGLLFIEAKPSLKLARWQDILRVPGFKLDRKEGDWQFVKAHQASCSGWAVSIWSGECFDWDTDWNIKAVQLPDVVNLITWEVLDALDAARGFRFAKKYQVQLERGKGFDD